MFLNVGFADVVGGTRIERENMHVHIERFVDREEVLDVHVGHAIVVAEGNFVDVAKYSPRLKSLRMRHIALLVKKDAAFFTIDVLKADANTSRSVSVTTLGQHFLFFTDGNFKFDATIQHIDEGFFMSSGGIRIFRVSRRTEFTDQLHKASTHLRRAQNRHRGILDSGDNVRHTTLRGDDGIAVTLDDRTVREQIGRITWHSLFSIMGKTSESGLLGERLLPRPIELTIRGKQGRFIALTAIHLSFDDIA